MPRETPEMQIFNQYLKKRHAMELKMVEKQAVAKLKKTREQQREIERATSSSSDQPDSKPKDEPDKKTIQWHSKMQ